MQIRLGIRDQIKILFLILVVLLLIYFNGFKSYALIDKTVYIPYGGSGDAIWDSGNMKYGSSNVLIYAAHYNNATYNSKYLGSEDKTVKYGSSSRRPALTLIGADKFKNEYNSASNRQSWAYNMENYTPSVMDTRSLQNQTTYANNSLSGYATVEFKMYYKDWLYKESSGSWRQAFQCLIDLKCTNVVKDFSMTIASYIITNNKLGTLYVKTCTSHTYGGYTTVKDSTC